MKIKYDSKTKSYWCSRRGLSFRLLEKDMKHLIRFVRNKNFEGPCCKKQNIEFILSSLCKKAEKIVRESEKIKREIISIL